MTSLSVMGGVELFGLRIDARPSFLVWSDAQLLGRYDRFWPDSEVAERPDDFRFVEYSGLVVLTASLSEPDPEQTLTLAH